MNMDELEQKCLNLEERLLRVESFLRSETKKHRRFSELIKESKAQSKEIDISHIPVTL